MIVFEILKFNRELIDRLQKVGFKIGDDRYIDLYEDYEKDEKRWGKDDLHRKLFVLEIQC